MSPTAPASGVHQVLGTDRRANPRDAGNLNSLGDGQLRNTQNAQSETLVGATSALSRAFHSDQFVMAEPSGTILRRNHREANSTRRIPQRASTPRGDRRLPRPPQPESSALCLDR